MPQKETIIINNGWQLKVMTEALNMAAMLCVFMPDITKKQTSHSQTVMSEAMTKNTYRTQLMTVILNASAVRSKLVRCNKTLSIRKHKI